MDFYKPKPEEQKDSYYEDQCTKAIEQALKEAKGKDLETTRYLLRRAYPFGADRKGSNQRPAKIWRRMISAKEAELGIESRKHHNRRSFKPEPVVPPEIIDERPFNPYLKHRK